MSESPITCRIPPRCCCVTSSGVYKVPESVRCHIADDSGREHNLFIHRLLNYIRFVNFAVCSFNRNGGPSEIKYHHAFIFGIHYFVANLDLRGFMTVYMVSIVNLFGVTQFINCKIEKENYKSKLKLYN